VARVGLASTFVYGGYGVARDPGDRAAKAARLGFPEDPRLVRANGAAMVLGGGALALGILPRLAATGLILSLVPTSAAGHPFWRDTDPVARAQNLTQTLKNLGLVSGLLLVATDRPRRRRE
jgi:uncharacterized membrane protein YphA (DoxX/SURF4 family)